jgi:dTDP-4-amino-4,6-dideoxygalactose transaminase
MSDVAFIDLAAQRRALGDRIDAAIRRVLEHGAFIMGPEIRQLEQQLGGFCGARHVLACSNGTDALALALFARGVTTNDAVFCPAFTFAATAEAAAWTGATPVFVDVRPDTFNMDAAGLDAAVEEALRLGLRPTCVIAVDLFGQPADYDAIEAVCAARGLWLLADAAQSFGAVYKTRPTGSIGLAATTSFFPAKPLGCYGDGGAVFTCDDDLAAVMRSLRVHGQGADKYDNARIGRNARLDTIQAAVLLEKLRIFPEELKARALVADRYAAGLRDVVVTPTVPAGLTSSWAQYTIRIDGGRRDRTAARLREAGVPTVVYYPRPLHRQPAYAGFPTAPGGLPVSERLSDEVLSLPMHPYLDEATQDRIVEAARAALRAA